MRHPQNHLHRSHDLRLSKNDAASLCPLLNLSHDDHFGQMNFCSTNVRTTELRSTVLELCRKKPAARLFQAGVQVHQGLGGFHDKFGLFLHFSPGCFDQNGILLAHGRPSFIATLNLKFF